MVALVTLLQFINILDFMMVMPLGPDFALALGMDVSNVGIVAGSYTLMAAVVAVFGAHYLDRFDRRPALAIAIAGLSLSTLAAAFAWDLYSLVAARMAAGLFGGPATSLAMSALIDVVPAARRGRAMAIVLASFSAASVLGVPFGLELARWYSWQAPFLLVGGLTLPVAFAAMFAVPAGFPPLLGALWVTVAFLLAATAFSIFQVPWLAL
ncbi:MAG: MFS transporter, partial [Proteobacteria bacterium]|nr:MFS transporter [Pseudomonadota bacterium]